MPLATATQGEYIWHCALWEGEKVWCIPAYSRIISLLGVPFLITDNRDKDLVDGVDSLVLILKSQLIATSLSGLYTTLWIISLSKDENPLTWQCLIRCMCWYSCYKNTASQGKRRPDAIRYVYHCYNTTNSTFLEQIPYYFVYIDLCTSVKNVRLKSF